jgi:putative flavoprotein involved in K+ transport
MRSIAAIVIGAGQAGLAMSHCLAARGVEHVVLERGHIGERWRSERWDSLRLLTPNWMSRLPGWHYRGNDPDGFMTANAFVEYLRSYQNGSSMPVRPDTNVLEVCPGPGGFIVQTNRDVWLTRVVVIATGHCDVADVPRMARSLSGSILQLTPSTYKNPESLPPGGVLVVGGSATGVQLADEIQGSGRTVTISVGRHIRLPRSYRGRDIWRWLDSIGLLDETVDSVSDPDRARRQPSFQLVGRPDRGTLDLGTLRERGVRLAGRVTGIDGHAMHLAGDLIDTIGSAQLALERLLDRIDRMAGPGIPPRELDATRIISADPGPACLDLAAEKIRTVIWATGYRRDYSWLRAPVLDLAREIVHRGGVTPCPGLYVLGLRFMRRRRSNFIDGVGIDAEALAEHAAGHLARPRHEAA